MVKVAFPRRFGPVRGIPISDRSSLPSTTKFSIQLNFVSSHPHGSGGQAAWPPLHDFSTCLKPTDSWVMSKTRRYFYTKIRFSTPGGSAPTSKKLSRYTVSITQACLAAHARMHAAEAAAACIYRRFIHAASAVAVCVYAGPCMLVYACMANAADACVGAACVL